MAEDAPTGTTDAPADKGGDKPNEPAPTFTQEQVNDLIAKEKGKFQQRFADYDDLKSKAAELDQIKESNATELEKAQSKLSKAEKERDEAKAALLRFEVAKEKEIPAEAIDLLSGSSREELEASADKILNLVKSRTEKDDKPDFDGGAREPAPEPKAPEQAHSDLVLSLLGVKPSN